MRLDLMRLEASTHMRAGACRLCQSGRRCIDGCQQSHRRSGDRSLNRLQLLIMRTADSFEKCFPYLPSGLAKGYGSLKFTRPEQLQFVGDTAMQVRSLSQTYTCMLLTRNSRLEDTAIVRFGGLRGGEKQAYLCDRHCKGRALRIMGNCRPNPHIAESVSFANPRMIECAEGEEEMTAPRRIAISLHLSRTS